MNSFLLLLALALVGWYMWRSWDLTLSWRYFATDALVIVGCLVAVIYTLVRINES